MEIKVGKLLSEEEAKKSVEIFREYIKNETEVYAVSVVNSSRRRLLRNLKPTKCLIEPGDYHSICIGPNRGYTIDLIDVKNDKKLSLTVGVRIFTTYDEAVTGYNEMIDETKELFQKIIDYRDSLKIKK